MKADVAKAADVEMLLNGVVENYGRLDCAFNNAGTIGPVAQWGSFPVVVNAARPEGSPE